MERDDRANLFVLEGVLVALLLLGAAYTVQTLQETSTTEVRPRTELSRLTGDTLVVLEGLDDGNGTSLLDLFIAEQFHCAFDAVPSTDDCDLRRSQNLSVKIDNYLPLGAGWALEINNGAESRELFRSPLPQGEAVASTLAFGPEWNLTFVATELSCQEAGTDLHATLVPIDRGAVPWTRWGNLTAGANEYAGVASSEPGWWDVTLAGATRPASGSVYANVTGNATLDGATSYATCDLHGLRDALRTALLAASFSAPATAPVGSVAAFSADLDAIEAVPGASITGVEVVVYEPLPPRNLTADTFIAAGSVVLSEAGGAWSGSWDVPGFALYGTHPALLRVSVDAGGTDVELRRVATLDIALPSGEVPYDPPYRAQLQTWLADWG